ncbi:hypothetical protein KAS42_02975 [bacterium]|nr:hypothetical protein [bacterium]
MKTLIVILCIVIAAVLIMDLLTGRREEAARVAVESLLEAIKKKDTDRVIQYLDYEKVVAELDMWASIGGADFTLEDMKAQLKANANLRKRDFDYEVLNAEGRYDGTVKVTVKLKEDTVVESVFIMKEKDGQWKCDLMATGKENAKMEEN